MASINFRLMVFKREIQQIIDKIYYAVMQGEESFLSQLLDRLRVATHKEVIFCPDKTCVGGAEIFSQFLQHFIYYILHNIKNVQKTQAGLNAVLKYPMTYIETPEGKIPSFWTDPQTGATALHAASRANNNRVVRKLLDEARMICGSDFSLFWTFISLADHCGFTPLNAACKEGFSEIVTQLLFAAELAWNGKNNEHFQKYISFADKDGFTPLLTACNAGHTETVMQLLAIASMAYRDASALYNYITHVNNEGHSSLSAASMNGHTEIVIFLLAHGAIICGGDRSHTKFKNFISCRNIYLNSPLMQAVMNGHSAAVTELLTVGKLAYGKTSPDFQEFVESPNSSAVSTLNAAARNDDPVIFSELIKHASKIYGGKNTAGFRKYLQQTDKNGFTVLITAAISGHVRILDLVISAARDAFIDGPEAYFYFLSHEDNAGFSALNTASKEGHVAIVEKIIQDVQAHFGIRSEKMLKILTQANKEGFSALISASFAGHLKIVELLSNAAMIVFGGKNNVGFTNFISHCTSKNLSSLNAAAWQGHYLVVDKLLADARESFKYDNSGYVRFIEQVNDQGFSPLNNAASNNYEGIYLLLLKNGANPQSTNIKGETALANMKKSNFISTSNYTTFFNNSRRAFHRSDQIIKTTFFSNKR